MHNIHSHQPAQAKPEFDLGRLKEVCGRPFEGLSVHYTAKIDSTMNLAPWCEKQGIKVAPWVCVIAGDQTHGVGQHGKWNSTTDDVVISIVLPEVHSAAEHAMVNCIAAFAVYRTLNELMRDYSNLNTSFSPARFAIKLANDVLAVKESKEGNSYKKISGSLAVGKYDPSIKKLIEMRDGFVFPDDHLVLGIGINLKDMQRPLRGNLFEPTSFEECAGVLIPREVAIGILLRNLRALHACADAHPDFILQAMKDGLAYGKDGRVIIVKKDSNGNDGEQFTGYIQGISGKGVSFTSEGKSHLIQLENIQRIIPSGI